VGKFTKASDSDPWAGAFAALDAPMDFGPTKIAKAKVWMNHIGNFALKLENSATGAENIELPVANTVTNEWEELIFDFSSIPDDSQFRTLTIFFDLTIDATGEDVTSYFDDIVIGDYSCGTVGVFEPAEVPSLSVAPNPVQDQLTVEADQEVGTILIFNAIGQQVVRTVFTNGNHNLSIDVANLEKGMYFLSLLDTQGALIGKAKFVKE
ncbi:MAG: T9SS type A sorting domain-containing protein, partial [Saprospiraceae bacterium]|nr:T9SS type A sorting domain-containing protein [Saprospiraceae bacterium]